MGLALARRLVELHGGRLWLDEPDGAGTCVRFVLPQAARPVGARHSPVETRLKIEDPGAPLVLVVEDDPQASDLLAHYIEAGGYAVARAYTAAEGLAMAERVRPFAITLDPALPDGDGLDLLRTLRTRTALATVPVVIVSVSPPRDDAVRTPAVVPGMCTPSAISAGYNHTCTSSPSGLQCWGLNSNYQLGAEQPYMGGPVQVPLSCGP